MRFLRKLGKRSIAQTPLSNVPGAELLDTVFHRAYDALGQGTIENIYRASLIGGREAVLALLEVNPKLASLWGKGELTKASDLLEVWASTVALVLFQNEPDQDAVCQAVATGFATVVFHSDADVSYRELRAYRDQQSADDKLREKGGIPTYAFTVLYLRCLKALGGGVDLRRIPIPIPSVAELLDKNLLAAEDNPSLGEFLQLLPILTMASQVAREVFDTYAP